MKRLLVAVAVALLLAPAAGRAQGTGGSMQPAAAGPFAQAMTRLWQAAARNMPAAADDMPAEKYSFKPTDGQMTFAQIIAHESQSNETLCADLAGSSATPSEEAAGATAPKEQLVTRIRKSFASCEDVVGKLTESELGDSVPFFGGRRTTKAVVAAYLIHDWADHYAQAAMYLRLNGILPPSARRRM